MYIRIQVNSDLVSEYFLFAFISKARQSSGSIDELGSSLILPAMQVFSLE